MIYVAIEVSFDYDMHHDVIGVSIDFPTAKRIADEVYDRHPPRVRDAGVEVWEYRDGIPNEHTKVYSRIQT